MGTRRIALIQGHPDPFSRHYCHALAEAYMNGARAGGHTVDLMEVARLEFPPGTQPWSKVEEMGRKAR